MTNEAAKDLATARTAMFSWALVAVASILIAVAARGDLWLDEVWSLLFAEAARSPWELITRFKHDNNHVLNTLYLYAVGEQRHLIVYRGLAVIAGIGSLIMVRKIALRWGAVESVIAVLLAGTPFPLLLYFSEARGYAPAIFFGLLSFSLLRDCQDRFHWPKLILFWCASMLGILSHLTFIIVFFALGVFTVSYELGGNGSLAERLLQAGKYILLPGAGIAAFYLVYARRMAVGGGPAVDMLTVLTQGGAAVTGLPDQARGFAVPLILVPVLWFLALQIRKGDREWSFYGSVLLLAPALAVVLSGARYFNYRYVLVCVPFYYLVVSRLLAKAWRSEARIYHHLALLIIVLLIVGQASRLAPFFRLGRGNYRPVLAEMAQTSPGAVITVGSDNDFRNKILLEFYSRFLAEGKTLRYIDQPFWTNEPPEWIIMHSLDETVTPDPWISTADGRRYDLIRSERFSGNSGMSWFLYRRSIK